MSLPPVGWANEVLRKDDLERFEKRMGARLGALNDNLGDFEANLDSFEARISKRLMGTAFMVNIPTVLGSSALALIAAKLGA